MDEGKGAIVGCLGSPDTLNSVSKQAGLKE